MKDKFIEIYKENIRRPGAEKLLTWLESSDFFEAPASTRFHLSRPGGLVEHSVHVYERLLRLYKVEKANPAYPGTPYLPTDEELESIAICGLLHDICKVGCYKSEPKNQKTYDPEKVKKAQKWQIKHDALGDFIWETVMGYKFDEDFVYGHGEKSVYIVSAFMKLTREEAVAIRFHMGPWQDGEKQNAGKAFEQCSIAALLHVADMMATYLDEVDDEEG